jgi:hypothetical protein
MTSASLYQRASRAGEPRFGERVRGGGSLRQGDTLTGNIIGKEQKSGFPCTAVFR